MFSRRLFPIIPRLVVAFGIWSLADQSNAISPLQTPKMPFFFDITSLTTTTSLPVKEELQTVKMSSANILTRLDKAKEDETIEPVDLMIADDETHIVAVAERLAKADRQEELADYLRSALRKAKEPKEGERGKTVEFDKNSFALVDTDAFADIYAKQHHKLTLITDSLKSDKGLRREFMQQLSPFLKKEERKALLGKIMKAQSIDVDAELLPEFARKMVGKYTTFRGPNCFHAALAFQSPLFTSSSLINVKREPGYHRAMINYDELWRALTQHFYEINPDNQPLKYGDMLVLFDVPAEAAKNPDTPVDFRWIRHTATYLFSGYTFSKGSKSPNTPYTVRTVADEWRTWKKYTKNLGVKVFRRSQKSVKTQPPMDLVDWIY